MNLNGFDYASYLKKHLMVGQIDPWRRTDEGKKLYTLLVPVDTAVIELQEWSGQEIDRKDFIKYLKINDILVFGSLDEFVKVKEELKKIKEAMPKKQKHTKTISDERKEELRKRMQILNGRKQETEKGSIL